MFSSKYCSNLLKNKILNIPKCQTAFILCKSQIASFLNKIILMNSYSLFEMLRKKGTQKQLKIYEIKYNIKIFL